MLSRSGRLTLPNGAELDTPALVPSFSSRGFGLKRRPKKMGLSLVSERLTFASTLVEDAFLISAYDLGHHHLPMPEGLLKVPADPPYGLPAVLFIDSGQYEADDEADPDIGWLASSQAKEWGVSRLHGTLARYVAPTASAMLVNLDQRGPLGDQIDAAREFFAAYPGYGHDVLLKSERAGSYLRPSDLVAAAPLLTGFSVVGVVEKELGNTILDRLETIARLRRALDAAAIPAPLHIFGSLDPLLSPLYFVAGAEIFDGLSWLYLAYQELTANSGMWTYADASTAARGELRHSYDRRWATRLQRNLTALENLAITMRRSVLGMSQDFSVFEAHADRLEAAYDALRTRLER